MVTAGLLRPDEHRSALRPELAAFDALADSGDPAWAVLSCAGWNFADLVKHVGRIHRWVAAILSRKLTAAPGRGDIDYGFPADVAHYPAWQRGCSVELVAALAATDPAESVWTWGGPQTAAWWMRRMLHETTVHRVDAELTFGVRSAVDPRVAVDGIDEFLVNLPHAVAFAPNVAALAGGGETIGVRAVDTGHSWLVTLAREGVRAATGGVERADAMFTGSAADLYLGMWGRRSAGPLDAAGDADLLARWAANSAI